MIHNYSFFVFGCLSFMFTILTFFFMPETKNKTIEEVKEILGEKKILIKDKKNQNENVE